MGAFTWDADDVIDAVGKWRPPSLAREKDYEEALYKFLHERFPKTQIFRQYTQAKTCADIYVDFGEGHQRVAIELKAHLNDRGEFHRLFGQMFEYAYVWRVDSILVLCGESEPSLVKLSRAYVDMLNEKFSAKSRFLHIQTEIKGA